MKIGRLLKERMSLLGISLDDLVNMTYIDSDLLENLYNNELDFEELDEYDKEILTNSLFCSKNYFIDENERKYDIVNASLNRGKEQDVRAIRTKCKIQKFVNDFIFINELRKESSYDK